LFRSRRPQGSGFSGRAARKSCAKSLSSRGITASGRARFSSCCVGRTEIHACSRGDETGLASARDAVVRMAVESWRFGRLYEKAVSRLEEKDRSRFEGQLAAFGKKIEEALGAIGMRIVNIEGTQFDPGIAATPLNIEDFGPDDNLAVDRMMEPIIMGADGLVRMGLVTLRKMEL